MECFSRSACLLVSEARSAVADTGVPRRERQSLSLWQKPIFWQDFCRKLHEKKEIRPRGRTSPALHPLRSANGVVPKFQINWLIIRRFQLVLHPENKWCPVTGVTRQKRTSWKFNLLVKHVCHSRYVLSIVRGNNSLKTTLVKTTYHI